MPLEIETLGDVCVVKVREEVLSTRTIEAACDEFRRLVRETDRRELRLDFLGVRYLSAGALGKLVALQKEIRAAGGRLSLANVGGLVYEVFQVTRLTGVLDVRRGPDKRILVVEDDEATREALKLALEAEGFVVSCAGDGRQALDLLRTGGERPALILLDLMMPVLDGWRFREEQKQDPALASIPVVVVSAATDVPASLGVADYLEKPVEVGHLVETIRSYC
jgi:anti-anti-sigma factor